MPCNQYSCFTNLGKNQGHYCMHFSNFLLEPLPVYLSKIPLSPSGKLSYACHLSVKNSKFNYFTPEDQTEENLSLQIKSITMPSGYPMSSYGSLISDTVVSYTWTLRLFHLCSTTCSAIFSSMTLCQNSQIQEVHKYLRLVLSPDTSHIVSCL